MGAITACRTYALGRQSRGSTTIILSLCTIEDHLQEHRISWNDSASCVASSRRRSSIIIIQNNTVSVRIIRQLHISRYQPSSSWPSANSVPVVAGSATIVAKPRVEAVGLPSSSSPSASAGTSPERTILCSPFFPIRFMAGLSQSSHVAVIDVVPWE